MTASWWLWPLAGVGALAIASGLITLFSALGRRPVRLQATASPRFDSGDFLAALAGAVNGTVQKGGAAELLDSGDAYLPAIIDAIEQAERTIDFMVYIWEPGEMSDRILHALTARAAEGVQVRLLLDGLGGYNAPEERLDGLRAAGARVARFRQPRFGRLTRFHKRNHRRAIVIDGRIGFTGGVAVADYWLGDGRTAGSWRDHMTRLTDCMAANLQSSFAELWAHCCGELLVGQGFFPDLDGDLPDDAPRHVALISSPSPEEHPVRLFFNLTFLSAHDRLWITTPYFVPDAATRANIAERARAGVDVRLLVPGKHIDLRAIRWAAHAYYGEMLDAGVRIWEYQPTMMHAKAIVADGVWSIVGSANLDIRSKELNEENVFGILDATFATQLERSFERDLEYADEIHHDEWRNRGLHVRLPELLARIFSEQF
jgi:cardiolipin synthase